MREYYFGLTKIHQAQLLNIAEQRRLLKVVKNGQHSKSRSWYRLLPILGDGLNPLRLRQKTRREKRGPRVATEPIVEGVGRLMLANAERLFRKGCTCPMPIKTTTGCSCKG